MIQKLNPCNLCIVRAICQYPCDDLIKDTRKMFESFGVHLNYINEDGVLNNQCLHIISSWRLKKISIVPEQMSLVCYVKDSKAADLILSMDNGTIISMSYKL